MTTTMSGRRWPVSDQTMLRVVPAARPVALPAMSFDAMVGMGDQLVRTGFLPAHLRTGAQVAAVILTGRELGMEPMRAVRSLSLVKGKVVESADSQLARFKADGGRAQFRTLTEQEAVLWLRHPNGDEHVESFSMADARNAGLTSSETYKKFPKAMLRSRVITAGLKSLGWEGGVGAYDPEELVGTPLQAAPVAAPAPLEAGESGLGEPVAEAPAGRLTLEEAEAMTAGKAKQRLGEMTDERLEALRQWAEERENARLVEACTLVLAAREPAEDSGLGLFASDEEAA